MEEDRVEQGLGRGSRDPSLLAGRLWDEHGRRMSPSHTTKRAARYRYYGTQTNGGPRCDEPLRRVSAPDIEHRVISLIERQLELARQSAIAGGDLATDEIQRIDDTIADALVRLRGAGRDQRGIICDLLRRVELTQEYLRVTSQPSVVDPLLGEYQIDEIRISCIRSGKRVKLVIPPQESGATTNRNMPLIKLVTQAMPHGRCWLNMGRATLTNSPMPSAMAASTPLTCSASVILRRTSLPRSWMGGSLPTSRATS